MPTHTTFWAFLSQVLAGNCSCLQTVRSKYRVHQKGVRSREIVLATTLTDPVKYPKQALIALYRDRWDIEVSLRDIKPTMGMDRLRCKSPDMIRREVMMFLIAYNCIRLLMLQSSQLHGVALNQLSLANTLSTLNEFRKNLLAHRGKPKRFFEESGGGFRSG